MYGDSERGTPWRRGHLSLHLNLLGGGGSRVGGGWGGGGGVKQVPSHIGIFSGIPMFIVFTLLVTAPADKASFFS